MTAGDFGTDFNHEPMFSSVMKTPPLYSINFINTFEEKCGFVLTTNSSEVSYFNFASR